MKITSAYIRSKYAVPQHSPMASREAAPAPKQKRFDQFTPLSASSTSVQDTAQTAQQVASALRRQYPWVSFTFEQLGSGPEDIAHFAASAGSGIHLVIDPEVLDWMRQGEHAFAQGLELIGKTLYELMLHPDPGGYNKGAVIADSGETTLWASKWERPQTDLEKDFEYMKNLLERLDEARKEQREQQKKLKLEQKKRLNYQMGRDMARLAKGTTDSDVRSLISSMYTNRQKIAVNSSYSQKEVRMALAQIDYVIGRARAKIRQLKSENDLELLMKKAENRQDEKKKLQLELELKARRKSRIARERAGIHEKTPDLPGLRDDQQRREAILKADAYAPSEPSLSTPVQPAAPDATGSSTVVSTPSGASVEVSITPMV